MKRFFYETFRPHARAEYAEFFTRGVKKEDSAGTHNAYPFVYARVFVIVALLFGFSAGVLFITENTITYPVVTLFGGLLVNLPLVVLAYELYPLKNINLPFIAAVALLGGTAATLLVELAYWFYEPANEFAEAIYVGFVEELCKALPCILIIRYNKNKTPFFGLLVGIAVGAGLATGEDIGYIFLYSNRGSLVVGAFVDYYELVSIAVVRAVTAVCTHIAWTGLIGYSFAKYRRPLSEPRFYIMFAACVILHAMWDMPVEIFGYILLALDYFICASVALTLIIRAFIRERRLVKEAFAPAVFSPAADAPSEAEAVAPQAEEKAIPKKLVLANALMGICATVIAVCGTLICLLGDSWFGYEQRVFENSADMIEFVQNGISFKVDPDREYSSELPDYGSVTSDGRLVYATQCVTVSENYDVYYEYSFEYGDDGVTSALENIWVNYDGNEYAMMTVETDDGEVRCFIINDEVYYVSYENGRYIAETQEYIFTGAAALAALLLSALVAAAGVAGGASILIKDKKRQEQNARAEEIFDMDKEN